MADESKVQKIDTRTYLWVDFMREAIPNYERAHMGVPAYEFSGGAVFMSKRNLFDENELCRSGQRGPTDWID